MPLIFLLHLIRQQRTILDMNAKIGDKVRVKASKERGIVDRFKGSGLVVLLNNGAPVDLSESDITNYSLAARKAWKNMPSRRVGRPKGTVKTDRVSVTLRINRELWEAFQAAEKRGLISDRTSTVNEWIAEKLSGLLKR